MAPHEKQQLNSYESVESIRNMEKKAAEDKKSTVSSTASCEGPSNEYVLNIAFFSFVGFLGVQTVFALIAKSRAMLADSEAMVVDAVTYLLNLMAERCKNQPFSVEELALEPYTRLYNRERSRLMWELVPPLVSALTLLSVTYSTIVESMETLWGDSAGAGDDDNVSVTIMFLFSGSNLLIDIVNVTCFARAHSAFGLSESIAALKQQHHHDDEIHISEKTTLLAQQGDKDISGSTEDESTEDGQTGGAKTINLNMCSAWTVRAYRVIQCNQSIVFFLT